MKSLVPLFFSILFMAFFILFRFPLWETAFLSDFSPMSWLSSVQLFAAALLAFRLFLENIPKLKLLMGWLAIVLTILSLDEQFMLHEQWKYGCIDWTSLCRAGWMRELPMLLIAIGGFTATIWFHCAVRQKTIRIFLWSSVATGAIALIIDIASIHGLMATFEEGFEVLSEALFLGALLSTPSGKTAG